MLNVVILTGIIKSVVSPSDQIFLTMKRLRFKNDRKKFREFHPRLLRKRNLRQIFIFDVGKVTKKWRRDVQHDGTQNNDNQH